MVVDKTFYLSSFETWVRNCCIGFRIVKCTGSETRKDTNEKETLLNYFTRVIRTRYFSHLLFFLFLSLKVHPFLSRTPFLTDFESLFTHLYVYFEVYSMLSSTRMVTPPLIPFSRYLSSPITCFFPIFLCVWNILKKKVYPKCCKESFKLNQRDKIERLVLVKLKFRCESRLPLLYKTLRKIEGQPSVLV